ncbi:hypothetical protein BG015_009122 [Linnemannia schmuckeri]|uniref:Uncharacterized protein n=1 Tax=Linnemannia schmuckeri TaxID=64567 RepID=A0A9P5RVY6_9FUNG|nr:hypothetical protein BG015_009122 [Linnemannia schmuckeri]
MTRLSTCVALALALVSSTLVMAQTPATAAAATTAATPPVGCVIATPQKHLKQGHPEEIEFQNCQGSGNVKLRYGDVNDLSADKTLACTNVQFSSHRVTCSFTPTRAGTFSLSTIDGSKIETFSGMFTVDPAPVAEAHVPSASAAKAVKGNTTGPHVQGVKGVAPAAAAPGAPQMKKVPASVPKTEGLGGAHKAEPMEGAKKGAAGSSFAKRALYDVPGFLAL